MHTIKIIAASAILACLTGTFGLKLAVAQEADKGMASAALSPDVPLLASPLVSPFADAVQAGSGELRFLGLSIYQARLWVSPRFDASDFGAHPLALELKYQRAFSAQSIAKRSLEEMRRIGPFTEVQAARWQQALQAALPDIQPGDRLVGLYRPGTGATFQLHGRTVGTVADTAFARLFFGVWLSPLTSQPKLRAALLGGQAQGLARARAETAPPPQALP